MVCAVLLDVILLQDDTYTESYISTIGVDFVSAAAMVAK
jgi:hypothetical protein